MPRDRRRSVRPRAVRRERGSGLRRGCGRGMGLGGDPLCRGGLDGLAPAAEPVMQRKPDPEQGERAEQGHDPVVVIPGLDRGPSELELEIDGQLVGEPGEFIGRGLREEVFGTALPVDQHLRVVQHVSERVGQWRRISDVGLAQLVDFDLQAALGRLGRRRDIQVHIAHQGRNGFDQAGVPGGRGLPGHAGGGERKVALGIPHHGIAGLEPLDALFLRFDGADEGVDLPGDAIGQVGYALRPLGELSPSTARSGE